MSKDKVNNLIWECKGAAKRQQELTPKERDVVQLLTEGRPMKEVAAILGLCTRTVAFHKYNVRVKLGIKTDAELVMYAMKNHVVAGPCPR